MLRIEEEEERIMETIDRRIGPMIIPPGDERITIFIPVARHNRSAGEAFSDCPPRRTRKNTKNFSARRRTVYISSGRGEFSFLASLVPRITLAASTFALRVSFRLQLYVPPRVAYIFQQRHYDDATRSRIAANEKSPWTSSVSSVRYSLHETLGREVSNRVHRLSPFVPFHDWRTIPRSFATFSSALEQVSRFEIALLKIGIQSPDKVPFRSDL